MNQNTPRLTIVAQVVPKWLGGLAIVLVLMSLVTQFARFATGYESIYGIIPLFDLDKENNIPTFFSTAMLLFASVILAIVAAAKRNADDDYATHWTVLATGFLYLAIDEAASIHELLSRPVRALIGSWATGIFYYTWVIPGAAIAVGLMFMFFRFWLHLPKQTRILVFVAALLFICGAIGVELAGGRYVEQFGEDFTYAMIVSLEEALEMTGVIVFIFAMSNYAAIHVGEARIQFVTRSAATE